MNWSTQPRPTTEVLGLLHYTRHGRLAEVDVTDYLRSLAPGSDTVGFLLKSTREGSARDFAELYSPSLSVTVESSTKNPQAISEPSNGIMFASGLALLGYSARSRRKKLPASKEYAKM
jgi:hypothetical protein